MGDKDEVLEAVLKEAVDLVPLSNHSIKGSFFCFVFLFLVMLVFGF